MNNDRESRGNFADKSAELVPSRSQSGPVSVEFTLSQRLEPDFTQKFPGIFSGQDEYLLFPNATYSDDEDEDSILDITGPVQVPSEDLVPCEKL